MSVESRTVILVECRIECKTERKIRIGDEQTTIRDEISVSPADGSHAILSRVASGGHEETMESISVDLQVVIRFLGWSQYCMKPGLRDMQVGQLEVVQLLDEVQSQVSRVGVHGVVVVHQRRQPHACASCSDFRVDLLHYLQQKTAAILQRATVLIDAVVDPVLEELVH